MEHEDGKQSIRSKIITILNKPDSNYYEDRIDSILELIELTARESYFAGKQEERKHMPDLESIHDIGKAFGIKEGLRMAIKKAEIAKANRGLVLHQDSYIIPVSVLTSLIKKEEYE